MCRCAWSDRLLDRQEVQKLDPTDEVQVLLMLMLNAGLEAHSKLEEEATMGHSAHSIHDLIQRRAHCKSGAQSAARAYIGPIPSSLTDCVATNHL